jgi:prepilin-type N-terminal cleavage/methylation domain-containing protein
MNTFRSPKSSRNQAGFTILELIVVIVIIGILLVVIISTRAGVQRSERDTERQRDIKELRIELEAFYEQNQRYPTLKDLNDNGWRTAHLKGFEQDSLQDPLGSEPTLVAKPAPGVYAYTVTSAKGTTCDDEKNPCTGYTLTATLENGGTFVKDSLN